MKTLDTDRLHLRPVTLNDAAALHQVVYSDQEVCRFFCGQTRSLDEVRERMVYRSFQLRDSPLGFLAIVRKVDTALIGLVALQFYIARWVRWEEAPDEPTARIEVELSYALGRDFWRHSYAAEACRAVIDYAFSDLRLPRIANSVAGANTASIALMRSLGFRLSMNQHPDHQTAIVGVLHNPVLSELAP
ncbi:MAG: GNAT family N-acetyltransferase [Herpetosiphonaceae bacterium]|nr:GNAT family N-acetyltransferase [Herpetosiphonaceae bacterium]